ncbi:unnamed protein product, partial [Timema podura]|nr:unnamed protein product [Timema podura]
PPPPQPQYCSKCGYAAPQQSYQAPQHPTYYAPQQPAAYHPRPQPTVYQQPAAVGGCGTPACGTPVYQAPAPQAPVYQPAAPAQSTGCSTCGGTGQHLAAPAISYASSSSS